MDTPALVSEKLALDTSGCIEENLPCVHCQYNLRGLDPQGLCPECGTPVAESARPNLLRFSDPGWVATLASGMNWIVAGIALGILLSGRAFAWPPRAVAGLAVLIISLVYLNGYWKLTTSEPGVSERDLSARRWVRISALCGCVLSAVEPFFGAIDASQSRPFIVALAITSWVFGIVTMLAVFTYARGLALRVPDLNLARNTRIVMCGIVAAFCLALAGAIRAFLAESYVPVPGASPPGGLTSVMFFGCYAAIAMLVFALWSLRLIGRYRKALHEAAKLARMTWARGLAPGVVR